VGNAAGTQYTSGFFWKSTGEEVLGSRSLTGKNVIVTGANSGIGKETARLLAKNGARVIVACRNENSAQEAISDIKKLHPEANLTFLPLDLSSLASVKDFVDRFNDLRIPLHILINNAGVMAIPEYTATEDGYETQFATNHLGHFYLTRLLQHQLEAGSPSRVVNVSSEAHRMCKIDFNDLTGKGTWYSGMSGKWFAYSVSKTCNILFTQELDKKYKKR